MRRLNKDNILLEMFGLFLIATSVLRLFELVPLFFLKYTFYTIIGTALCIIMILIGVYTHFRNYLMISFLVVISSFTVLITLNQTSISMLQRVLVLLIITIVLFTQNEVN